MRKVIIIVGLTSLFFFFFTDQGEEELLHEANYKIVDTGTRDFYSDREVIPEPGPADAFFGQDAHYQQNQPSYMDHGDGTVTDNVTGLMWVKDMGEKMTWENALSGYANFTLAGYDDWRMPGIKELYSLILFTGRISGSAENSIRFIDTRYFIQPLGNEAAGERFIDAQTWSATEYVGTTMRSDATVFGVNFVDGRIKGYPKFKPVTGQDNKMYVRYVRGNHEYGENNFRSNGNGTVSDLATGLMWQQADDGIPRNWEDALAYAENLDLAGYHDWRLPNAKELQSIVDYTRAPEVTMSAAIDPVFLVTGITDPEGQDGQFPYFWTGTTHLDGPVPGNGAVYIAFGKAQGYMNGLLMDVHGAGAQRSDPKDGDPDDYPSYWGPQGDVRYVFNYVRCVRDLD